MGGSARDERQGGPSRYGDVRPHLPAHRLRSVARAPCQDGHRLTTIITTTSTAATAAAAAAAYAAAAAARSLSRWASPNHFSCACPARVSRVDYVHSRHTHSRSDIATQ